MARYTNAEKRLGAELGANKQGYAVRSLTAQGVPERARIELSRPNQQADQAIVRTSNRGLFGFRRNRDGEWQPNTKNARWVLTATVSDEGGKPGIEVLAFPKEVIVAALNAALAQLVAVNRAPPHELPVFISIDPYEKADFGPALPGIRNEARWREFISSEELSAQATAKDDDYVEEARRKFAKRNGVDIRRVTVNFSVAP